MRKASKLLLILGGVFSIVSIIEIIATSLLFAFVGVTTSAALIVPGAITVSIGDNPEFYSLIAGGVAYAFIFIVAAVVSACYAIIPLIASIFGFIGSANKPGKGKKRIFVVNLVFGILMLALLDNYPFALASSMMIILGGIFGIVAVEEEKKALEEKKVEEEK